MTEMSLTMAFRSESPSRQAAAPAPPPTRAQVESTRRHFWLILASLILSIAVLAALLPEVRTIMAALAAFYLVGGVVYIRTMSRRAMAKAEAAERGL
jgi:hypothetical protein